MLYPYLYQPRAFNRLEGKTGNILARYAVALAVCNRLLDSEPPVFDRDARGMFTACAIAAAGHCVAVAHLGDGVQIIEITGYCAVCLAVDGNVILIAAVVGFVGFSALDCFNSLAYCVFCCLYVVAHFVPFGLLSRFNCPQLSSC